MIHSDNTLRIWGTETGECHAILEGHTSRIWDVSTTTQGDFVASASGDGTVKVGWLVMMDEIICALMIHIPPLGVEPQRLLAPMCYYIDWPFW